MGLLGLLAVVTGGGYVSIWKTIPLVVVLLVWARLLTWADKDTVSAHLPRGPLNLGMLVGMVVAFGLFFYLPFFIIAFPVLLLLLGAEVGTYLILRQRKVGLADLKEEFAAWLKSFRSAKKVAAEVANEVNIYGKGGGLVAPPGAEDVERAAFDALQECLSEPLRKRADRIDMQPAQEGFSVRYQVDGVSYKGAVIERGAGAAAVSFFKGAAGLDVNERRKPQRATIKLGVDGAKREFRMDTLGNTSGEFVSLLCEPKKQHEFTLDKLGLSEKQLALLKQSVQENQGIVLVTAPKDSGLTSMLYAILRAHDAFLQHIHTIEREPAQDLEGITQNKIALNASAADETKLVDWVISQEPDVVLIDRIEDPRTAVHLAAFAKTGKRVYVGMRVGNTFEALAQWRKLIGDDKAAVGPLVLIVAGRVLRKLCSACKMGYAPDPATLKKLNMSPERVQTLFQARSQPLRDAKGNPVPCDFCNDLHFKGRTGVFETFAFDDGARAVVTSGGSENQLKAAFRKLRSKYLQEEALALVEKGETSVQEVLRVLKGGEAGGAANAPPGAAAAPARPRPTTPAKPRTA